MRQLTMAGYRATYGYDAKDERVAWVDSAEAGLHYILRGLHNQIRREVHELTGGQTRDNLTQGEDEGCVDEGGGRARVRG